ncbi:MAG: DUF1552 domain-containing protein [Gemmatimonadales bacterium]|nr:DUF1552 domain-containing protein [Gemmatimonadales bacterium]
MRLFVRLVVLAVGVLSACSGTLTDLSDAGGAGRDASVAVETDANVPRDAAVVPNDALTGIDARVADDAAPADAGVTPSLVPDRIVFVITPHGTLIDAWSSPGAFEGPILAPLAPYRDRTVRITGLDVPNRGAVSIIHGSPGSLLGGGASEIVVFAPDIYGPSSATVDQWIARASGAATRFASLELGVGPDINRTTHVFAGPAIPVPQEHDPRNAAARLALPIPGLDSITDPTSPSAYPQVAEAQIDVAVAALQSDLTRVITIDFQYVSVAFAWLGITTPYHEIAHDSDVRRDDYARMQRWYAERVASLATSLESVLQPDGNSLLDHTLIVWVTDSGGVMPSYHDSRDVPVLLLGNVRAGLVGGRLLDYDRPINDLWLTIGRAFGADLSTGFGDPAITPTPIDGLFAAP